MVLRNIPGMKTLRSIQCGFVMGVLGLAVWALAGCGLFSELLSLAAGPTTKADTAILAKRTGCSEFSHSVALTAVTDDASRTFQWFFTDGVSQVGRTIVHTFEDTGTHSVTLIADGKIVRTRVTVPVRGEDDGSPDPFGDDCIPNEGDRHLATGTDYDYRNNPPASGPHFSGAGLAPTAPGFYEDAIEPEVWVHNLEHGDVVILYDCSGECPADFLAQLEAFFNSIPQRDAVGNKLVMTRYPGLASTITAVAWDVQRSFDSFDSQELRAFYDRRVGQAPEG